MPTSSVTITLSADNQKWIDTLDKGVLKAARYTLSDVSKKALAATKEALGQSYNLSPRKIPIVQHLAPSGLSAILHGEQRGLSLFNWKPLQDDTGVSVTTNQTQRIEHAFILKGVGTNNFSGVFIRTGNKRYPIKSLYGASFPNMLNTDWIRNVVDMTVVACADEIFERKLKAFVKW